MAISKARAILALALNILILPGLGSLIGKKRKTGIWQIVLCILGVPLIFAFGMGILLIIIAWIWGIVTGAQLLDEANV